MTTFEIVPAVAGHVPAIARIYAHHVLTGVASFEITPPDETEMAARMEAVHARGLPYLVAEADGQVAGYAYAGPYRPRPAYRFTVENAVYVAPEFIRRGIGRALLQRVVDECTRCGCRQMVAIIGDSGNSSSIGLHRACGFEMVGVLQNVGYKFDRWLDTVVMQRTLGDGGNSPP